MIFNDNWTKLDNDFYRQLIREGKSIDDIIRIIGMDKLKYHPKGRYLSSFSDFLIKEIKCTPEETRFKMEIKDSEHFKNESDFQSTFKTKSETTYIIDFVYMKDTIGPFPNKDLFNLSFTTLYQHDLNDEIIYENPTNKNEHIELMKRLIYIIEKFDVYIRQLKKEVIYFIGQTNDTKKINFYRSVIKDSFDNVEEIEGESSFNKLKYGFYYKIL